MTAEIHRLSQKPVTVNWMCSACGVDAGCNCGAPLMSKAQRAVEAIKSNPEKSDRVIAENLGIGRTTVQRAREEVAHDGPPAREGRDGKSYPVRPARIDDEVDAPKSRKEAIEESRSQFLNIAREAIEDAKYCNTCDLSPILKDKKIIEAVKAAAAAWCQLAAKLEGKLP